MHMLHDPITSAEHDQTQQMYIANRNSRHTSFENRSPGYRRMICAYAYLYIVPGTGTSDLRLSHSRSPNLRFQAFEGSSVLRAPSTKYSVPYLLVLVPGMHTVVRPSNQHTIYSYPGGSGILPSILVLLLQG